MDGSQTSVYLNGVQLEQVHHFKYLGSVIEDQKIDSSKDIHSRIGAAANAFGVLSWCIWRKTNISIPTKIRLFRTLILPVLLYGSEYWTILQDDMKKLEVFQMRCLRRILGVTLLHRIRNSIIRERCCNQPTIEEQIQQHRLRWFGHVCRMEKKRFPLIALGKSRPIQWKVQRTAPKKNCTLKNPSYRKRKVVKPTLY